MSNVNLDWKFTPYVFVYGSLKSGHWNNVYLSLSDFIGEFKTSPDFVLVDAGFPYALHREDTFREDIAFKPIAGEIWRVDSPLTLRQLDRLEGHPNHYCRVPIYVDSIPCWIYLVDYENVLSLPVCQTDEEGNYVWPE